MRRKHNSVLVVILVVVIGLCLLPGRAEALTANLNVSPELGSLGIYGDYATVNIDVTFGEAYFSTWINHSLLQPQITGAYDFGFQFRTDVTLQLADFHFGNNLDFDAWELGSGWYIEAWTGGGGAGNFYILNPNITPGSEFSNVIVDVHSNQIYFSLTQGPEPTQAPEPTTMLLLGSGLIGLVGYGRKKLFKK
jgi:hypothetical protein